LLPKQDKTAYIIAGPNGSGKTTFSISLIKSAKILTGMHLNADIIAKANNTETNMQNHINISNLIEDTIDKLIEDEENLILETVFSSPYKMETFKKLKKAGYKINIIFVATEDPLINVTYVAMRYLKNGHEIPISKIIKRYEKSINNLKMIINEIDCLILIDNSVINQTAKIYTALSSGNQCFINNESKMPTWISELLNDNLTKSEEADKQLLCEQIQGILDIEFKTLITMDTDDMLELLTKK
jgi:predicted ABC-type ATPase